MKKLSLCLEDEKNLLRAETRVREKIILITSFLLGLLLRARKSIY